MSKAIYKTENIKKLKFKLKSFFITLLSLLQSGIIFNKMNSNLFIYQWIISIYLCFALLINTVNADSFFAIELHNYSTESHEGPRRAGESRVVINNDQIITGPFFRKQHIGKNYQIDSEITRCFDGGTPGRLFSEDKLNNNNIVQLLDSQCLSSSGSMTATESYHETTKSIQIPLPTSNQHFFSCWSQQRETCTVTETLATFSYQGSQGLTFEKKWHVNRFSGNQFHMHKEDRFNLTTCEYCRVPKYSYDQPLLVVNPFFHTEMSDSHLADSDRHLFIADTAMMNQRDIPVTDFIMKAKCDSVYLYEKTPPGTIQKQKAPTQLVKYTYTDKKAQGSGKKFMVLHIWRRPGDSSPGMPVGWEYQDQQLNKAIRHLLIKDTRKPEVAETQAAIVQPARSRTPTTPQYSNSRAGNWQEDTICSADINPVYDTARTMTQYTKKILAFLMYTQWQNRIASSFAILSIKAANAGQLRHSVQP